LPIIVAVMIVLSQTCVRAQDTPSVWTDPATGLTWTKQDAGRGVTWNDAKSHCQGLRLEGHPDWRLPTIDELRGIFDPSAVTRLPYVYIKGQIQLSVYYQWSDAEAPPQDDGTSSAWEVGLVTGNKRYRPVTNSSGVSALCVSGRPAQQTDQGPTLDQTVQWLRAKFSAEVIGNSPDVKENGIINLPFGQDDYLEMDFRFLNTISQEQCHEYGANREMVRTLPCIHLTPEGRLGWNRHSSSTGQFVGTEPNAYIPFEEGTDIGPMIKALKHLAVLHGAKFVDDDLFKP
jgi:hypothetical protein